LFDLALHGWRQPIERLERIALEQGWPIFAPEPGVPTDVVALNWNWWRDGSVA
jgi:hypothetical protein